MCVVGALYKVRTLHCKSFTMTLSTLMHSARMRLCSFPDGIAAEYGFCASSLARQGYYWDDHNLRCFYDPCCVTPAASLRDTARQSIIHVCHSSTDERAPHDIPHSIKGYFYLNYESHRLLTFKQRNWPHKFITSDELAACGFYYTGHNDITSCAFCPLKISRWEAGDTAFGEHMRWNSNCPFVRGKPVGNFTRRAELEKLDGARFYSIKREMCKFLSVVNDHHLIIVFK
jgi:Inhibitor of Apoptosis domain